ncbi:XTP/dITP diphosphatase [Aneurinibacillus sp. Ricciae_BoGa-3]|uniref:XTP/dITP diphosphatase n=1 Tax=Aneurinibacillus sp. Ricciae_BoGa-3 TaxID=3022697 RepID=UPI0023412C96|nr:XTP/dITP diphosphatase [Aneurinibacillus sp. Ricciae_BoGa-3]WCK56880.1 XTP/dITP diphosphatase [Aneurinibacillus sp. Ricciae_BoGa-3]
MSLFPWKQIVFATRNKGKVREFSQMFDAYQVEVKTVEDFPGLPEVVEDGETFEANAVKKAETICRETGIPALADDSGLEVDALEGKPGVYSARFAGEHGDDQANNAKLVALMRDIPAGERAARFVSVLALAIPDGETLVARGTCEGEIVLLPAGSNGFGYDPYFFLPEQERTMAELEPEEKNAISHRGNAMRKLHAILQERYR